MAAAGIHISIAAEPIFSVGGFEISNSIFTSLIVSTLLIVFGLAVRSQLTNTKRPTGIQNFAEWLIESLFSLVYSVTGNTRKARLFFPIIATYFLFILLNNWLGLLPGVGTIGLVHEETSVEEHASSTVVDQVHAATEATTASEEITLPTAIDHATDDEAMLAQEGSDLLLQDEHAPAAPILTEEHTEEVTTDEHVVESGTEEAAHEESEKTHTKFVPVLRPGSADLNTTLALALISVALTQIFGYHFQSFGYFSKFFNFSSPIMFYVGILELISEFAKIISFAFRLFGNIFAGEVLLTVMAFLMPLVVPMPFYGLELFVGFIQALVFSMLTLVFFNMASESHESH